MILSIKTINYNNAEGLRKTLASVAAQTVTEFEHVVVDGITIGDGADVGAGAVVTRDIPPYAIATGVPTIVIKYRFDKDTIDKLLQKQWWNSNEQQLHLMKEYNSPRNLDNHNNTNFIVTFVV